MRKAKIQQLSFYLAISSLNTLLLVPLAIDYCARKQMNVDSTIFLSVVLSISSNLHLQMESLNIPCFMFMQLLLISHWFIHVDIYILLQLIGFVSTFFRVENVYTLALANSTKAIKKYEKKTFTFDVSCIVYLSTFYTHAYSCMYVGSGKRSNTHTYTCTQAGRQAGSLVCVYSQVQLYFTYSDLRHSSRPSVSISIRVFFSSLVYVVV